MFAAHLIKDDDDDDDEDDGDGASPRWLDLLVHKRIVVSTLGTSRTSRRLLNERKPLISFRLFVILLTRASFALNTIKIIFRTRTKENVDDKSSFLFPLPSLRPLLPPLPLFPFATFMRVLQLHTISRTISLWSHVRSACKRHVR